MPTVLVTGANKGIGLEFCRQYRHRGADVIATCRQASPELEALNVRIVKEIEMTSDEAAARLARELSSVRIDVLILNAGVYDSMALGKLDFARMLHEYDVDALGPLRVTQALLPNLGAGAKVVFISSRAGSIGDNGSGGNYGYRMAKAAFIGARDAFGRRHVARTRSARHAAPYRRAHPIDDGALRAPQWADLALVGLGRARPGATVRNRRSASQPAAFLAAQTGQPC